MRIPKFYLKILPIFLGVGLYASDWVFFINTSVGFIAGMAVSLIGFMLLILSLSLGGIHWFVNGLKNPYGMQGLFLKIYQSLSYINKKEKRKHKKRLLNAWIAYQKLDLTNKERNELAAQLKESFSFILKTQEEQEYSKKEAIIKERNQKFHHLLDSLKQPMEISTVEPKPLPLVAQSTFQQIEEKTLFLLTNPFLSQTDTHYLHALLEQDLPELIERYYALSEEKRQQKIQSMLSLLKTLNEDLEQKKKIYDELNEKNNEQRYDNKEKIIQAKHLVR